MTHQSSNYPGVAAAGKPTHERMGIALFLCKLYAMDPAVHGLHN